jgi:hypothetical protein
LLISNIAFASDFGGSCRGVKIIHNTHKIAKEKAGVLFKFMYSIPGQEAVLPDFSFMRLPEGKEPDTDGCTEKDIAEKELYVSTKEYLSTYTLVSRYYVDRAQLSQGRVYYTIPKEQVEELNNNISDIVDKHLWQFL